MRTDIILAEVRLWPLLPLVKVACSDDETDSEASFDTQSRKNPLHVRKLEWRSPDLEGIWTRLDKRKDQIRSSMPGNRQSPAVQTDHEDSSTPKHGRQSRPRIRSVDAPQSPIKAPVGLSKDCYLSSWVDDLEPRNPIRLGMKAEPILPAIIEVLDELGY